MTSINDRSLELSETVFTLDLKWYPSQDRFKFKVEIHFVVGDH